jgi:hypothetical protein
MHLPPSSFAEYWVLTLASYQWSSKYSSSVFLLYLENHRGILIIIFPLSQISLFLAIVLLGSFIILIFQNVYGLFSSGII